MNYSVVLDKSRQNFNLKRKSEMPINNFLKESITIDPEKAYIIGFKQFD